ncbi:MAG: transcription elongation GreA/GreB family factor [Parvicellaceae bacterium]|jgi:transcription elongation GreA/GreB family factor
MIKKTLFEYCEAYVSERVSRFSNAISDAQSGANNETKSSAGDKHETGRAMAQLETENNSLHLSEAKKLKSVLRQIDPNQALVVISLGAVVKTDKGNFYIAISAGKTKIGNIDYFIVSAATPVGQAFVGKKAGDIGVVNGKSYEVLEVL